MLDVYDERLIPLDPEPLTLRESKFFRLMAFLGLREKNARDVRHQQAVEANRPIRAAEAASRAVQSGKAANVAAQAASMLGKVGGGL